MARTRVNGPEELECIAISNWLRHETHLDFYHFANERKTSWQYGAFLKAIGVQAGVADYFFPQSSGPYKGLWIEVKAGKGKLTEHQKAFLDKMIKYGYMAVACWGRQSTISFVKEFYKL